ncbi:MAG: ATP-binding protein [Treponema sp.]|nr:ATP-binding protein [Treponema sp.]
MAIKRTESTRLRSIANFSAIAIVIFLSAAFVFETLMAEIKVNYSVAGLVMIITLLIITAIIRNSINHFKMAFNVPFVLLLFYTALMMLCGWYNSHYMLISIFLIAISCIYSNFNRTLTFIIVQNIIIAFLFIRGTPIGGEVPMLTVLINWVICIFSGIIMLLLTRAATVILNKALEHQNSFMDLLASTENFVAMIDERNEVVYASKTLSELGNTTEPTLVQGRPLIDLFPGRSLKIHAGKLLKEKDDYAEDWEFSLNGQKRFFKAASHSLPGGGGTLISLYDMTHLAERDEIAVMKDSMRIGLFFMDKNFIIQDHYSRYLEEMLSDTKLFGKVFTDVISDSVNLSELEAIKDYFKMILERTYDQDMLEEINPLNELHYVNRATGEKKVFQFAFATVERGRGEVFILVTVYDITTRVELQQRLAEEEARRQEEMQAVFELIQVEPDVFSDFMSDMEHEFESIDKILKNESLSAHDALVKVYQSVHAIKSNAVILGLNVFGNKVHNLESKIKKLREMQGEVPFGEMLNLTMEIEKISQEKEGFRSIIDKLQSYAGGAKKVETTGSDRQKVMIDSLTKTTTRVAADLEKKIKFIAEEIDTEAIERGPRREMKEILMQLIRNSAVHGVETPKERKAKGKKETGIIKLSIKLSEDRKNIIMKLTDDGKGLDYKKIAERALSRKLIKKEDAENKDILMKAIFSPGFSTAETEGIHGGRGIGLNLVRDRLKEIRGTVKLRSEDNKGTLFFMSIPLKDRRKRQS